jgi:acyl-CoA synthetase (AMP-forming)/AMP-acid ligase II
MSSWTHSSAGPAPASEFEPATLVELLRRRALRQPEQRAYTFLVDAETEEDNTSYGELDAKARAIAAALQSSGAPGQRVLLLFPPSLDYIAAFFGCLYAGMVAVPLYPPRSNYFSQFLAITTDAQATAALTTPAIYSRVEKHLDEVACLKTLRWITNDSIPLDVAEHWQEPVVSGNTLAFLQYTSGSTSAPKGVMVTHGGGVDNPRLAALLPRHGTDRECAATAVSRSTCDSDVAAGVSSAAAALARSNLALRSEHQWWTKLRLRALHKKEQI